MTLNQTSIPHAVRKGPYKRKNFHHGPPTLYRASPQEGGKVPDDTDTETYTDEEVEFLKAIDCYKRENRRPFPTWSEVLSVLRCLGWRKIYEAYHGEQRPPCPTEGTPGPAENGGLDQPGVDQ